MSDRYIIVSRHPAAVQFARYALGDTAERVPVTDVATVEAVRDRIVVGNIPLNLCAYARCVRPILFMGAPPRGQEYTLQQMIDAGAYLGLYVVIDVDSVVG